MESPGYDKRGVPLPNAWAAGPPASAAASLPAPSAAPGSVYQITDANNSWWQSDGTIWRPANGKAVLASRNASPVTVQSATQAIIETIGPFPGGLVTNSMRLNLDVVFLLPGIGTGSRYVNGRIGAPGSGLLGDQFWYGSSTTSSATNVNRALPSLLVRSSTSAAHVGSMRGVSGTNVGIGVTFDDQRPVLDFSSPWELNICGASCDETATTITAASWAAGVATFGATAHTLVVGDKTTVAGVTPSGYNGVYVVSTVPNADTFTVALASDPGAYTSGGTSSRISNVVLQSYILGVVG